MRRAARTVSVSLLALASFAGIARAADPAEPKKTPAKADAKPDKAKPPASLTVEEAGPEYRVQGEYVGTYSPKDGSKAKLAAQVIALGDGAFQAVILPGGLPGDGWDGKTRIEVPGKAADPAGGEVTFAAPGGKGYSATYGRNELRVQTDDGATAVLAKVERTSPTEGAKPPAGATVLFDGTNVDAWDGGKMDDRHLLAVGAKTKKPVGSFTLHAEFVLPFKPLGRGQDRGNSGFYVQRRYEVQVLDTFGHPPEKNGCAAMYTQQAPLVNMCYPPLRWQTYDIDFQAAEFGADGKKTKNAVITVKHNGVVVQDKYEFPNKTGAGEKEGPAPGPLLLQDHGNPVFYRNVWIVEK